MGRSYATTIARGGGGSVCARCGIADTPLTRLKGLLGKARLRSGEGLLIRPTSAVHTFFMRFSIDVVFLDQELVVVGVEADLQPWRVAGRRGAKAVLELPAGESSRHGIRLGERLRLVDPRRGG